MTRALVGRLAPCQEKPPSSAPFETSGEVVHPTSAHLPVRDLVSTSAIRVLASLWRSIMQALSRRFVRSLVASSAFALPLVAWSSYSELTLQPESKLWVDGTSTMRKWTCRATDLDAVIDGAPNAIAQVAAGEKGVRAV